MLFLSFLDKLNMIDRGNELKHLAKEANLYGNYELEIKHLNELIQLKKDNDDIVYLNLAHAYFNNNQSSQAQKLYLNLVNSNDATIKSIAYQQLGILYAFKFRYLVEIKQNEKAQNQLEKALSFFKKSLIANPKNNAARYNFELLNIHPLNFKKPKKETPKTKPNQQNKKANSPQNKKDKNENQPKEGEKMPGGDDGSDFKPDEAGTEKQAMPTNKPGDGKNESTSNELDKKNQSNKTENASGKSDPNGTQKGGTQKQENGRASEHGDKGKIDVEKKALKEKPQLNKDKLKKMNLSIEAAEKILNDMKMAEKQYIQQQQKKANQKHNSKNESRW